MKIPLTYGALMAVASSLVTLLLFFLGYHSDAAKMQSIQPVQLIVVLAISFAGITMGMRARRAQIPPHEPFSYGRALGTGVLIGLCAALFGAAFNMLYATVINSGFNDVMMQMQTDKLEAKGMSSDQIEKASGMMKMMFNPIIQFIFALIIGTFSAFIISLIAAAFVKRPDRASIAPPLPTA
jgi:Protein of unknown function (DUF4199)